MANTKLASMTANTAPAPEDLLYTVTDPSGTPADRKVELGYLIGSMFGDSFIRGLITDPGTDGDHDIDFLAGAATVTDGSVYTVAQTSSTITKQLDASWAVGDAAGGLDTGSIAADTWYHYWMIMRSDTGVVDFLFSTSATSPTMPSNYDFKRRIGACLTDSYSNITSYFQRGDRFMYADQAMYDVNNIDPGSGSWVNATVSCPLGVETGWYGFILSRSTVGGHDTSFWHGHKTAPSVSGPDHYSIRATRTQAANAWDVWNGDGIITNTSSQIQYYPDNSAIYGLSVGTLGWDDPRGRTLEE